MSFLEGENDNPGQFELFYGEVDDAVAAIDYLRSVPYVDPSRIYLAGHSTGGSITLYPPAAKRMEEIARQTGAPFRVFIAAGEDHFTALQPLCGMVARKILADTGPTCAITVSQADMDGAFQFSPATP